MLSEIITGERIKTNDIEKFIPPSPTEVSEIIEINRKKKERDTFIEKHSNDPENAAKKKADEILALAQEKYKSMEIEAETLKIKAENEIRQKLTEEFEEKLNDVVKKVSGNFFESLDELSLLKRNIYENSEKKLLELVFQILEKIIGNEVRTNPDIVVDMLRKGFERIKNTDQCEIRINPDDFKILADNKIKIDDIVKSGVEIKFIKSDKVERGGCVIKTAMGDVIAEPLKQLETVKKEIVGA